MKGKRLSAGTLVLTDLTLHLEHLGDLVDANQRCVPDVSQDVGQNAGSLRPAGKGSVLFHLYTVFTHSLTLSLTLSLSRFWSGSGREF